MINRLHYEMIRLYSGDPMRIQHFCKVHSYAKLIAETPFELPLDPNQMVMAFRRWDEEIGRKT